LGVEEGVFGGRGEVFPEEDGGHGADFREGRGGEELGEPEQERVGVSLFAEIEEELRCGSLFVRRGHKVSY
jgi:hypothetical protein